ncbi:MAG: TonB-dependent receptor [Acidobacteriota bacterium]
MTSQPKELVLRKTLGLALVLCLLATAAFAQGGSVTGFVLDARTGQPVRGATLVFEGADLTITSDLSGVFQSALGEGTWTVLVTADGYETQKVVDVVVTAGGVANVSVVLNPTGDGSSDEAQSAISEEVTVTAEAIAATETALLAERKSAAQIVDNIGSEEISKNAGSNAAGALKRVTGISVQDSKFVFVRGLGERYSNTQLNGSKMPSTEFERKVVPLDLFSSGLLEKITVSKSYTVDQPGDFAAGVVSLETKQFPARQRFSFGASASSNDIATGEDILNYPGGLSFSGDGGQGLPAGFPSEQIRRLSFFTGEGFTDAELEGLGESLIGDWTPERDSAPFDSGFNITYGNSFDRLGLVLSGNWGNSFRARDEARDYYRFSLGEPARESFYDIEYGTESVRQSLMGNLAYRLGDNTQIRFRGLLTDLAQGEGRIQTGFFANAANNIIDNRIQFKSQDVQNLQLSADHFFSNAGSGGSLLEWRAAVSTAETGENLRQALYDEVGDGTFQLEPLGQSGFLFFNDLEDDLNDYRVDWSTFFSGDNSFGSVKFGLAATENERTFVGRRMFFSGRPRGVDFTAPPEDIYTEEFIERGSWVLREVTNNTDNYVGTQDIYGAYAQGDWSFGKWRLIGGLRFEDQEQEVLTIDPFNDGAPTRDPAGFDESNILPAFSAVYSISDRQSLRASASRTVNRPEFREIASFAFLGVLGGFTVFGNPELEQATIDALDVRWEWYPSAAEIIAFSVFYKDFDSPIEQVAIPGSIPSLSFANATGAENAGFEVEIRRALAKEGFFRDFTGILNYTFVDSQIELDPETTDSTNLDRALAGQPDNVLNAVLEWAPNQGNTIVRLLYNFKDDTILFGGRRGLADVIEDSRSTFDIVWQQTLPRGFSLTATATNLADEERFWTQGGESWRIYNEGVGFGLSFGYSFQ